VPGGYTIDRLRDELALRIAAIPEFRAKLADSQLNLDYPVWVEDDAFDLDRHLLHRLVVAGRATGIGRGLRTHRDGSAGTRQAAVGEMWVIEVFATPTRARAVCWR